MSAEGFAAVPNWMIHDESFTVFDIAVYAALASLSGPGGIHPSQGWIASKARCSERRVRQALVVLEERGVIERVRRRSGEGRSTTMTNGYLLHPNGRLGADEERLKLAARGAGTSKLPASDDEATGTSEHLVPLIDQEPNTKKSASDLFGEFWSVYPRHVAKAAARTKFLALVKKLDGELVVAGARAYAGRKDLPEEQFIPYPATWLNQRRWEDEVAAPVEDENAALRRWLEERGTSMQEYRGRYDEPGWLESLEQRVSA